MNKRSTTTKSATDASETATTARGRERAAGTVDTLPPEAVKFMEAYQTWQRSFENPVERQTYIENICQRIAEEFQPEKIILFGSYAYGTPTPDSDVDLLVIMPFDGGYFHQAAKIRQRLGSPVPMDLLVRTPEQIRYRLEIGDRFIQEILEHGKIMYEAHHD